MPVTFNVISLGTQASIDPTEGNNVAENASALVGQTFGDVANPLWEQVQSLSPAGAGFGGGNSNVYDMNNANSNDQFSLDGGAAQTFDGTAIYNATITYTDGTTDTITAVLFQDVSGNTYLAPEFSANSDQTKLEAGPIRSLSLDSLAGNVYSGTTGSRQTSDFMVCFAQGAKIRTPLGDIAVQNLRAGDKVCTLGNGNQPIRWIGCKMVSAQGAMEPICISKGALGQNLPSQDLVVSRQHMMMTQARVVERMFGTPRALVAAHKLTDLDGIAPCTDLGFVTYWHILCDNHEIVFANDAPSETLFVGPQAQDMLDPEAMDEINALFPELPIKTAQTKPSSQQQKRLVERLHKNQKQVLQNYA